MHPSYYSVVRVGEEDHPACLTIRPRPVVRDNFVINLKKVKDSYPSVQAVYRNIMPEYAATSRNIQQQMHQPRQPGFPSYGKLTTPSSKISPLKMNDPSLSSFFTLTVKLAKVRQETAKTRNAVFLANIAAQNATRQFQQLQLQIETAQNHAGELMTTHYDNEVHANLSQHPYLNSTSYPPSVDLNKCGHQYMATKRPVFVHSMEPSVHISNKANSYDAPLVSFFSEQFVSPIPISPPETQETYVKHAKTSHLSNPMVRTVIQNSAPVSAEENLTNCTLPVGAKIQPDPDHSTQSESHKGTKKRNYKKLEIRNGMPRRPFSACKFRVFSQC